MYTHTHTCMQESQSHPSTWEGWSKGHKVHIYLPSICCKKYKKPPLAFDTITAWRAIRPLFLCRFPKYSGGLETAPVSQKGWLVATEASQRFSLSRVIHRWHKNVTALQHLVQALAHTLQWSSSLKAIYSSWHNNYVQLINEVFISSHRNQTCTKCSILLTPTSVSPLSQTCMCRMHRVALLLTSDQAEASGLLPQILNSLGIFIFF